MSSITWNETSPAAASLATNTDDTIRSDETAMGTGLGESLFWPNSGGGSDESGGETIPGMARFHRGPSRISTAENGFVSIDTGGSFGVSFKHIGTSQIDPLTIGHCNVVEELGTTGTVDVRWVEQQGSDAFADSTVDNQTITFATAYDGIPAVRASIRGEAGSENSVSFGIHSITATNFQSTFSYMGPGAVVTTPILDWVSKGTMSF